MYRLLFGLVLARMDAERAHRLGLLALGLAWRVPGVAALARRALVPRDPVLRVRAFGRELPGPLGLAAGLDKEAEHAEALAGLGFGFVEVGTVTALAQPGNPRPRIFRLPADRALVNRMGFPNAGAEAAAARLRRPRRAVVGVNVGRSKAAQDAVADYRESAGRLAPLADFLVLNVSSPNTAGLRDLQAPERLGELVAAVRAEPRVRAAGVALLVKVAPDLSDAELDAVADLAVALGLDGIVATNTTVAREGLRSSPADVEAAGAGGLSGAPLKARSLEVLRRLRARVGDRVVLVSVGGVQDAADVWERVLAGATLVQAYTGLVYGGPLWPRTVHRDLARLVRAAGFASVGEAVGTGSPAGWARA